MAQSIANLASAMKEIRRTSRELEAVQRHAIRAAGANSVEHLACLARIARLEYELGMRDDAPPPEPLAGTDAPGGILSYNPISKDHTDGNHGTADPEAPQTSERDRRVE